MRANRRRIARARRTGRRQHERYLSSEAAFWHEILPKRMFSGTFKEFMAWPDRMKFSTRMAAYYSEEKVTAILNHPNPFYSKVRLNQQEDGRRH